MIRFELIEELESAKHWWNTFSPGLSLYDSWNFRFLFYKHNPGPLKFYIGFEDDTPVGLFPLQKNIEKNYLEFFGGSYMENNQIFMKSGYESYRGEFYKHITEPAFLEYIIGDDSSTRSLPVMDEKFFLTCAPMKNLEDYFQNFLSGESRGKMRRKMRHVESENVTFVKNKMENIEYLFQLNGENFGERSTFHLPGRKESFRELLSFPNEIYLLSFYREDALVGVSLAVLGNDKTYEYLNLGVSQNAPKDLKSYIHLKNIEMALLSQAAVFNAGCSDCGWKELFHLQKSPQYKFDKTL